MAYGSKILDGQGTLTYPATVTEVIVDTKRNKRLDKILDDIESEKADKDDIKDIQDAVADSQAAASQAQQSATEAANKLGTIQSAIESLDPSAGEAVKLAAKVEENSQKLSELEGKASLCEEAGGEDADDDLDIADENGNVLARFANGHFRVKNFSSKQTLEKIASILTNIGFDKLPEFNDEESYVAGDIVIKDNLVYKFKIAHEAGEWKDSEVDQTDMLSELGGQIELPVSIQDGTDDDLDIADENGNVLARFANGHFRTKYFDSKVAAGKSTIHLENEAHVAWEPQENYEAWPHGCVFYDKNNGKINIVYSGRDSHLDNRNGRVYFRSRYEFGKWAEPVLVADNSDGVAKRCHGAGVDKNGNYIALVLFQRPEYSSNDCYIHVFRSTNKGTSWSDEGAIKIDGNNIVVGESGSCFLCKSGRLLTMMSKSANTSLNPNCFVAYSDDNGATWKAASPKLASGLESGFVEIDDNLYMLMRQSDGGNTRPILYKSEDDGTTWEVVQVVPFSNYNSPTSIAYDEAHRTIFVVGGDRTKMADGYMSVRVSVESVSDFINGNVGKGARLLKSDTTNYADFGYAQIVITDNSRACIMFYQPTNNGKVGIYELNGYII